MTANRALLLCKGMSPALCSTAYLRCAESDVVISNIVNLAKNRHEFDIGVHVALVRSILQVVCVEVLPYFFVTSIRGCALLPMTGAGSTDGVSGLLKPVSAPSVLAVAAFFAKGIFAAVAMNFQSTNFSSAEAFAATVALGIHQERPSV